MNPKDLVGAKKSPIRLVPPAAIIGMADGLSVGAKKYGPFNWRQQPIENVTYVEAALRHLFAYLDGQEYSEDTEAVVGHPVHHIDHALAGLGILRDAIASGQVVEARLFPGPAADLLRAMDHSASPAVSPAPEAPVEPEYSCCPPDYGCNRLLASPAQAVSEALTLSEPRRGPEEPITHEVTSEAWGAGDGPVFVVVDNRGVWPPDSRVAGRLTCCGQTEHALDCPQWR